MPAPKKLYIIENIDKSKYPYITIIGDAGSGKTTFVKSLFLGVIEHNIAIPIFIELRNLKGQESILNYLHSLFKIAQEKETLLEELLKDGKMIFFLDGYDELEQQNKVELLDNFVVRYSENKFILTSRPSSRA